jgi:hypothetical protein
LKCYCYETNSAFTFCVEDAENKQLDDVIQHMAWRKIDDKFLLTYPQTAFSSQHEKELIKNNFNRLGEKMFSSSLSGFDWKPPLEMLARKFNEHRVEWYIVGSIGDALRGVDVKPSDIDIVVHTKDYANAKEICYFDFPDSIIAPFTGCPDISPQKFFDNPNGYFINPLTYFGRMFLNGAMIEVTADKAWDAESRQQGFRGFSGQISKYEKFLWNGYDLCLESIQLRREVEIARDRKDRVKALEEYMAQQD